MCNDNFSIEGIILRYNFADEGLRRHGEFFFDWYRLLPTIPRDSQISFIPRWKAGKRPNKCQDPFPKEREATQVLNSILPGSGL